MTQRENEQRLQQTKIVDRLCYLIAKHISRCWGVGVIYNMRTFVNAVCCPVQHAPDLESSQIKNNYRKVAHDFKLKRLALFFIIHTY